jgi:hypothetical protein
VKQAITQLGAIKKERGVAPLFNYIRQDTTTHERNKVKLDSKVTKGLVEPCGFNIQKTFGL